MGEGTDEYKNPAEFFRRTYLTENSRTLEFDTHGFESE
jgi:predicted AAA+ superfamily ATPase